MDRAFCKKLLKGFVIGWNIADERRLVELLSTAKEIRLPLMTLYLTGALERFNYKLGNCVSYVGRAGFETIDNQIGKTKTVLHITGAIGSGKSHLLAAFVFKELVCRLVWMTKRRRIVYLSSCSELCTGNLLEGFKSALALAFIDDDAAAGEIAQIQQWEQVVAYCNRQDAGTMLFILDDYNYFLESPLDSAEQVLRNSLLRNIKETTAKHAVIRGVSARSAATANLARSFQLPPRLTEAEWDAWVATARFARLHIAHTDSRDMRIELMYMTGRNPLVMALLCDYELPGGLTGACAIDAACEQYQHDNNHDLAGVRISLDLNRFLEDVDNRSAGSGLMKQHVSLLVCAMGECAGIAIADPRLYDSRYFVRENYVLKPVCGFVAKAMAQLLAAQHMAQLQAELTPAWAAQALFSENRSVRGFAYELCTLANIQQILCDAGLCDRRYNFSIVFFEGDWPPAAQLNTEPGTAVFYWPRKWNLRYVDGVVRVVRNPPFSEQFRPRWPTQLAAHSQALQPQAKKPKSQQSTLTTKPGIYCDVLSFAFFLLLL
jgi:hypothetical protein